MKNKKVNKFNGKMIITIMLLLIVVIGGTFAWFTYRSKETALVLSIGDINDSKVIINPYEIRETMIPANVYTSGVYSQVTVINNTSNDLFVNLFYRINELDNSLIDNGLKYTIATSESLSGVYDEIYTGDFSTLSSDDDKINIFEIESDKNTTSYYRVYIWLDSSKGNQNEILNMTLDIELNAKVSLSADVPILDEGMIPVVIADDGSAKTVSRDDANWYNYNRQKWANAVLVNGTYRNNYYENDGVTVKKNVSVDSSHILAYYVWIPRYKYKIWTTGVSNTGQEQEIEIIFESRNEPISLGTKVGDYRTHPAFLFDRNNNGNIEYDEMLPGIWVGKFETTGTADTPTVLPNVQSLREQDVSTQFTSSLKFSGGVMNTSTGNVTFNGSDTYGLTAETDSHMMKNSEWGAVAYLSHSQYGINDEIYINNSADFYTGRSGGAVGGSSTDFGSYTWIGQSVSTDGTIGAVTDKSLGTKASTTGNVTGVYDMSLGASEYVMGNFNNILGNSGFSVLPDSKYYDVYLSNQFTGDSSTNTSLCTIETCGGHALSETANWYSDTVAFINADNSWFVRNGIFNAGILNGRSWDFLSWRSVLVPPVYTTVNFDKNGGEFISNMYSNSGQYGFVAPYDEDYKIELWGAQSGNGGKGAYTSGVISLNKDDNLYIYVGGAGGDATARTGGYNGGGTGGVGKGNAGGGGGATDVRYFGNYTPTANDLLWNSSLGLKSRIMVAAGGSTDYSNNWGTGYPFSGGGLSSSAGRYAGSATQTSAGTAQSGASSGTTSGGFGYGGNGGQGGSYGGGGAGGGGYYGGSGGSGHYDGNAYYSGGTGGSSFISGHTGCVAIESSSSLTPRVGTNSSTCSTGTSDNLCSIHYSGKKFNNTVMIDGTGYLWSNFKTTLHQMPNPTGGYYNSGVGHSGNGAVKISQISSKDVIYQDKYGNLPTPTRDGYTFIGWYTDPSNGDLVTENTIMNVAEDHTLYARWIKKYTINFDANEGTLINNTYTSVGQYGFVAPRDEDYKIELWGAQGGNGGRYGAYTSGIISLNSGDNLYFYIGEQGGDYATRLGGYNGGGTGGSADSSSRGSGGGGGATDVRYFGNYTPTSNDLLWNSSLGLKSRIMVAAGGGTRYPAADDSPGTAGGGLNSLAGRYAGGATQIAGGIAQSGASGGTTSGIFGIGGNGGIGGEYHGGGAGGGGYYGGAGGSGHYDGNDYYSGGTGGSSFISGHTGCVAIESSSSLTPRLGTNSSTCSTGTSDNLCSIHYSGKQFSETLMIDGDGYLWSNFKTTLQQMPNPSGGFYDSGTGHTGNGVVKISQISSKDVIYQDKYGNLPTPTRDGYTFEGWYTDPSDGDLVTENTIMNVAEDHTLYARWSKKYTINFDANGGTLINNTYNSVGQYDFVAPYDDEYYIQLWGAQGGGGHGYGAYTSGIISLNSGDNLYIYVGGKGEPIATRLGGYNGGGTGGIADSSSSNSSGGGGATDIRYFGNYTPTSNDLVWNSSLGLKSRIMVAAGGSTGYGSDQGSGGGGLSSLAGRYAGSASQTFAGAAQSGSSSGTTSGGFGYGGNGGKGGEYSGGGAGGGGYYGGSGGSGHYDGNDYWSGGTGGSSFISGHTGCVAIESSSSLTPRVGTNSSTCITGTKDNLCSIHYSGKQFSDTLMIDGDGYLWSNLKNTLQQMPNPSGGYYDSGIGHTGNGVVKISQISSKDVIYQDKYGNLPTPTRDGYTFIGWYTEPTGGDLVTENTIMNVDGNHTLYARWN